MMLTKLLEGSTIIHTPSYRLSNGREMPGIGMGTFLGFDEDNIGRSKIIDLRNVVARAIDIGYRHFDTTPVFQTEVPVGQAIYMKLTQEVVTRESLFITSKLWNTVHKKEQVHDSIKRTLKRLGVIYVDLYLMHWPIGLNEDYSFSDVDFMETWRGMEEVQRAGLAKSIGVANFNKQQLQRLLNECAVKPVALLIEVHPVLNQQELIDFCKSKRIVVMAYCALGSLVKRFNLDFPGPRKTNPVLVTLAKKYNKTPAQIVLRWAVDRGVVPLPKSCNINHLNENLEIFDFRLLKEEVELINKFNSNYRYACPSYWQNHLHYPFEKVLCPMTDPFRSYIYLSLQTTNQAKEGSNS